MNDDNYSRDLHAWIEPEIEARVVALILGEASEFEAEELERLMEERPEIRSFKQRLEGLHGLLGETLEPTDDDDWKLPVGKRNHLLESMELAPPPSGSVDLEAARDAQRELRVRRAGRRVMFSVAACFVVTLFFAALISTQQATQDQASHEETEYFAETAKAEQPSPGKLEASGFAAKGPDAEAPVDRFNGEGARANRNSGTTEAFAKMDKLMIQGVKETKDSVIRREVPSFPTEISSNVTEEVRYRIDQADPLAVDSELAESEEAPAEEAEGDPFGGTLGRVTKLRDAPSPTSAPSARPAPAAIVPGTPEPTPTPEPPPLNDVQEAPKADPEGRARLELDLVRPESGEVRGRGKSKLKPSGGVVGGVEGNSGGEGFGEEEFAKDERTHWNYRGDDRPTAPAKKKPKARPGVESKTLDLQSDAGLGNHEKGLSKKLEKEAFEKVESRQRGDLGWTQPEGQEPGQGQGSSGGEGQKIGRPTRPGRDGQGGQAPGDYAWKELQDEEKSNSEGVPKPGGQRPAGPTAPTQAETKDSANSLKFYNDGGGNGGRWERQWMSERKKDAAKKKLGKELDLPEDDNRSQLKDQNIPADPGNLSGPDLARERRRATQGFERDGNQVGADNRAPLGEGKPADGFMNLESEEQGSGSKRERGGRKQAATTNSQRSGLEDVLSEKYQRESRRFQEEEKEVEEELEQEFGDVSDIDADSVSGGKEGADFAVQPGESTFGRKGGQGRRDRAAEQLQSIVLPDANFSDLSLEDAVELLEQKTEEAAGSDKERKKLSFAIASDETEKRLAVKGKKTNEDDYIERNAEFKTRLSKLHLKNVRADEALKAVADQAGMTYEIQENGTVLLIPQEKLPQELFEHREWSIPLSAWRKIQDGRAVSEEEITAESLIDAQEQVVRVDPRTAFANYGIELSKGEVATYFSSTGVFSVSGTEENLKKIEEVVTRSLKQVETEEKARDAFEKSASTTPTSTFSLHVSDVSFKLSKAALDNGQWPQAEKVRVEEFVNAFDYGDPGPSQKEKVAARLEQARHPFLLQRNLLRISMKTAALGRAAGTPLRLTILLDNSGSMDRADREAAVQKAFSLLAAQLGPQDRVTLIGFARTPRLMADGLTGDKAAKLVEVIATTPSEGGTNIEEALRKGVEKAREHFLGTGQNRIILLTDGAANLGNAEPEELLKMVEGMRQEGIAFDACGVGSEGLNDKVLESLTRKGDGRYYFLDRQEDADEGFAKQIAGALRPAARNVKVQLNFNPRRVGRYRLYGFDTHRLKKEDFLDDTVDAAEMAAEEAGNAIYQIEVLPEGEGEIGTVSVRFEDMATRTMVMRQWTIPYESTAPRFEDASNSLKLAGIAALTGEKLKGSIVGGSVELPKLNQLMHPLPNAYPSSQRVADLAAMIARMREIAAPAP